MDVEDSSDLGDYTDAIVPAVSNDIVQSSSHLACIDASSPIIETTSKERIHVCAPELKPVLGMIFDKLEDGLEFYKAYAANSGFVGFDPIAIKNYSLFGDMTSFDTTFNMNTYKMIFAPFTGVDHHKKCVTFGAGLIRKETDEDFVWLFRNFLSAMSNKYPVCIINDQDRGIKAGVKTLFGDKTQHRYCMWHIMKKLPDKIGTTLYRETNFMKELCSCVWAEDIELPEFEERWCSVISSYGLTDNEWLDTMFDKRASWIPAYFRDLFMGGLMRTTSRSESENSFFRNFMNPNLTLVEFLMRFESAMDAQRWKQSKLIAESKNAFPDLETPHPLEKHASEFYTPVMFSEFKNEWVAACFTCGVKILGVTTSDSIPIIDREKDKVYYVNFISDEMKLNCSCKNFERHGILCHHALYVLKEQGLDNVPDQYLLSRWSKLATCQPICNNVPHTLIEDCNSLDVRRHKIGTLWPEVFSCVTLAEQKPEYVDELLGILKGFKDKISAQTSTSECSSSSSSSSNTGDRLRNKNRELEMLLGTKIPKEVVVLPPIQSKTKGSGKRMMSQKEKATKELKKAARKCNACGELGFHDSRNCPGRV
ncbi:protein FAR1-RELATED SEQUENCE 5-like [Silene latifolia]|uniref:protein FAR1-RELATED SEQUENCE 5-like n=1 Tax=Silene latifolia TaxID=37657 RepID=UPI003D785FF4